MRIAMPEEHRSNPLVHLPEHYAREIVAAGARFADACYRTTRLSLREFEAGRMRTALINGCELCQNFRVARDLPAMFEGVAAQGGGVTTHGTAPDEDFYASIAEYRSASGLTERERLAAEFADGMGLDPQGIARNEEFWARFKAAFSDEEIVDLTWCTAQWMGLGRAAHVLGLDGLCALPERVQEVA